MTAKSPGVFQVIKDAPLGARLSLAAVWFGALLAGTGSFWMGDWLYVSVFLAIILAQPWIIVAVYRGAPPSTREKIGLWAVIILVNLLGVVIVVRSFVS